MFPNYMEHRFHFNVIYINVLERQTFFPIINNIAYLRLLFHMINRRDKYGMTWNM